jgi:hypothetical protein
MLVAQETMRVINDETAVERRTTLPDLCSSSMAQAKATHRLTVWPSLCMHGAAALVQPCL